MSAVWGATMTDLDPAAIMAEHPRSEHVGGMTGRPFCESDKHEDSTYWPCETYRLAEALELAWRLVDALSHDDDVAP